MTLSDQALTCIMVALQKSLMEQTDIVPVLKGFKFDLTKQEDSEVEELVVENPPTSMLLPTE
jgi:hypothetical protein